MFCYIFPNAPISSNTRYRRSFGEQESEDISLFPHYAPIAQLVEQLPLKETVPGSSPGRRTTDTKPAPLQVLCVVRGGALFCDKQNCEPGSRALSVLRIRGAKRLATRDHTKQKQHLGAVFVFGTGGGTRTHMRVIRLSPGFKPGASNQFRHPGVSPYFYHDVWVLSYGN